MKISEIIKNKNSGQTLSKKELSFVVENYLNEMISDKEMSEFLFCVIKNGLSVQETVDLTEIMAKSGDSFDLTNFSNTIDKHSTGGVSDSTTLIVVPLFALFGYTCIKMSGGSLSHTGGTSEKIKVFEGLNNELDFEEAVIVGKKAGACFITSTKNIAPADKKIYALRDKINAMSVPLIASSIMSKKIASGSKNLVLDVKFGSGAFIKTKKDALVLARLMKKIGTAHKINTSFVLGEMNQPLGQYIGDVLEVKEVVNLLQKPVKSRLLNHSLELVAEGLYKQLNQTKESVLKQALEFVENGKALKKLKEIVFAQGGKFDIIDKEFSAVKKVFADRDGIVSKILTKELGFFEKHLKQTTKDYYGLKICVELGQKITKGQEIFELYFDTDKMEEIENKLQKMIRIKKWNLK